MDAAEGRELWSLNPDQRVFPASLTKMMTAALSIEGDDPERMVVISEAAASVPESGLSLEAGERLRLGDLLEGALIWSANDAAFAVGEAVAGNMKDFVTLMNRRARSWGATSTQFTNPHGLHAEDHYATARDLAAIAVRAMKLPGFRRIVAMKSYQMLRPVYVEPKPEEQAGLVPPATKLRKYEPREFLNRNQLLEKWELCDGIKTGYTREAGRCLAASATRHGWQAIAVVLNAKERWDDARALLEWAFAHFEMRTIVREGQDDWRLRVWDGVSPQVRVATASAVRLLLPKAAAAPQLQVRAECAQAPISQGDRLGTLDILVEGKLRAQVSLVAAHDVELSLWGQIKRLSVPSEVEQWALILAAGVLLLGTAAKAARARRYRLKASRRATHPRRPGVR